MIRLNIEGCRKLNTQQKYSLACTVRSEQSSTHRKGAPHRTPRVVRLCTKASLRLETRNSAKCSRWRPMRCLAFVYRWAEYILPPSYFILAAFTRVPSFFHSWPPFTFMYHIGSSNPARKFKKKVRRSVESPIRRRNTGSRRARINGVESCSVIKSNVHLPRSNDNDW